MHIGLKEFKRRLRALVSKLNYFIAGLLLIIVKKLVGLSGIRELGRRNREAVDISKQGNSAFVYMLELEQGCYYVGSTIDMTSRWAEHQTGRGAKFTRVYKPIRIERVEEVISKDAAGRELRLTALAMLNYGINRVRGAYWCKTDSFTLDSLEYLFPPIAHVLGLNYNEVQSTLIEQLRTQPFLPLSKKEAAYGKKRQRMRENTRRSGASTQRNYKNNKIEQETIPRGMGMSREVRRDSHTESTSHSARRAWKGTTDMYAIDTTAMLMTDSSPKTTPNGKKKRLKRRSNDTTSTMSFGSTTESDSTYDGSNIDDNLIVMSDDDDLLLLDNEDGVMLRDMLRRIDVVDVKNQTVDTGL